MQAVIKSRPIENESVKRAKLKALDDAIAERRKYYNDQEKLITDLVEAGNTELMGLHHDILLAKQELRNIKTDIRTFAQDKVLLKEDIVVLQREIAVLVPTGTLVLPAFAF